MKKMKHETLTMKHLISYMLHATCYMLIASCFMLHASWISAAPTDMESPRFRIQGGNVNSGSGQDSSSSFNLSTTIGQVASGEFQSNGYVVKAGFQYIHSIIPFQFSVSNTTIPFGQLVPNTPSTATTTLAVSFGSAGQYQVTAGELGPLQTLQGTSIPDTQCNGGTDTCDETRAALWNSTAAYGFGYTMSGQDIPTDFATDYYRPFPDLIQGKAAVVVMSNANVGKSRQATMTFKTNVSGLQQAGTYQTIINFVAIPSF